MPRLVARSARGEEELELRGSCTVGRDESNDWVLAEPGVSRRHCRLWVDDQGLVWIEDLGSRNGVVVRGERIARPTALAEGEVVRIGPVSAQLVETTVEDERGGYTLEGAGTPPPLQEAPAGEASAPAARMTRLLEATDGPQPESPAPAPAPEGPFPRLEGVGAFAGREVALARPRSVVGRDASADVLLDDDSVSRKHAELCLDPAGLSVRDLDSVNGTFVNGARVSAAPLRTGDRVRFGAVELRCVGAGAGSRLAGKGRPRGRWRLWGAAGLAAVAGAALVWGGPTGEPIGGNERPEGPSHGLGCQLLAGGKPSEWAAVVESCEAALRRDPGLSEASRVLQRARAELEASEQLARARQRVEAGHDRDALVALARVEPQTGAFSSAREVFRAAAERVARQALRDCEAAARTRAWALAWDACRQHLEVTCHLASGGDRKARDHFERAARELRRGSEVVCPPEYAAFQVDPEALEAALLVRATRARYPEPAVFEAVARYVRKGRPRLVADELRRAQRGRALGQAAEVIDLLERVDGHLTRGQAAMARGDPEEAEKAYAAALEAEGRLLPGNAQSALARDLRRQLASAWLRAGVEQRRRSRLREAFDHFLRGRAWDPADPDLAAQLAALQAEAARALERQTCDAASHALAITLPDSAVHRRALQLRARLACP